MDECLDQPCHPTGTAACHSLASAFYCQCLPGHTGKAWNLWDPSKTRKSQVVPSQQTEKFPHPLSPHLPNKSPAPLAHTLRAKPTVKSKLQEKPCVPSNVIPTTGQRCEAQTDPCQSQPCSNGGSCEVTTGPPPGFTCHCPLVSATTAISVSLH